MNLTTRNEADDSAVLAASKQVSDRLGLSLEEALRGVQYGVELADKEARDAGDQERAERMVELFESTIRVGRKLRT